MFPPAERSPSLPAERDAALAAVPDLVHAFYGRSGGCSSGELASLNLSDAVGDDPRAVRRNWATVVADLGGLSIARMRQVHGATVAQPRPDRLTVGDADGMITADRGMALAVLTADCVPILMAAPRGGVVMALHAGWRGTAAGIAALAVARAQRDFAVAADEWLVALGPSIGACCYEVGSAVGEQITARFGAMPEAWTPAGEKGHLDLRRANRRILRGAGVSDEAIHDVGGCTACAPRRYYSHRASGGVAGRQLSVIGWRACAQRTA